jgi:hypothetical protein
LYRVTDLKGYNTMNMSATSCYKASQNLSSNMLVNNSNGGAIQKESSESVSKAITDVFEMSNKMATREAGGETSRPRAEVGGETSRPRAEAGGETSRPRAEAGGETSRPRAEAGGETSAPRGEAGEPNGTRPESSNSTKTSNAPQADNPIVAFFKSILEAIFGKSA